MERKLWMGQSPEIPSQLEDSIWPLWNQLSDYFCQWGGSMALLLGANLKQALLFLLQPSAARKSHLSCLVLAVKLIQATVT